MNKDSSYTNIDRFRLIAALLVIAIHTSPLLSVNETADFILTRISARVAVPFFFMVSGFFLISKYNKNNDNLFKFIKTTLLIYSIAILFYIPLNIYSGSFDSSVILPEIIKDVIFNGTLYHLWYLPASITGACIAWFAVKRFGFFRSGILTAVLYLTGLFGDSYYGISEKIPWMKFFYENLFYLFDYTRNGIFFAPVFFVMGGYIAHRRLKEDFSKKPYSAKSPLNVTGFILSMLLMIIEGMLLHKWNIQRHDSMYIMLLPCMYFLFNILISRKGSRNMWASEISLAVYLIHPMIIVFVRFLAKFTNSSALLVENSIIHYIAVSIFSVIFSFILLFAYKKTILRSSNAKNVNFAIEPFTDRAWIELNLENLRHNVNVLTDSMPAGCNLMPVIKANAYGHGDFEISAALNQMGINNFAVATADEAIRLRKFGITGEILVLGYTHPSRIKELHKYHITQTLADFNHAKIFEESLKNSKISLKAHIKIDTGMHRLGFSCESSREYIQAFSLKNIKITGIFTHLSVSDSINSDDIAFTKLQISRFQKVLDTVKNAGIKLPDTHIQSSYGLLNHTYIKCNYARVGIALYGILSSPDDRTVLSPTLRPVLSLKSRIAVIKKVKPGEWIGYGRTYAVNRTVKIAILPIGYADGFPRSLSENKGKVLINNTLAPIIGRICMDQLAVDITHIPTAETGSTATLISSLPSAYDEFISAPDVAEKAGTISNELLSRLGCRLKTVVLKQ